jgi:hypothetical protein
MRRNFFPYYGKRIYKLALYEDYYLINRFRLKLDEDNEAHIDHLLCGDKFIYVIKDKYFPGGISGNEKDSNWFFHPFNRPRSSFIPNPFLFNRIRIQKLALVINLDESFFINIIVVNDDCILDKIQPKDGCDFICNLKNLNKIVKANEARDIPILNPEKLAIAVKDLDRLNKGIVDES